MLINYANNVFDFVSFYCLSKFSPKYRKLGVLMLAGLVILAPILSFVYKFWTFQSSSKESTIAREYVKHAV